MNPFSRKKKQPKMLQAPPPRELKDIQNEYNQLSLRAGQCQYQTFVLGKDLEQINHRLVQVNQEAAERNKLDAAAKAKAADAEATKEVKSE